MSNVQDLIAEYGKQKQSDTEISWDAVAVTIFELTGVKLSANAVRKRYKRMCESNQTEYVANTSCDMSVSTNTDGTQTSECKFELTDESKLRDNDFLLRLHNYDANQFTLVSSKSSKWQSGDKTLYSSKIVVKPKSPEIDLAHIRQWFKELNGEHEPIIRKSKDTMEADKLLVLPISDLHYGMLSKSYNQSVARTNFGLAMQGVISRIDKQHVKKIIYTIGGDFINCDNPSGTTTKGTPQDNDGLFYDIVGTAFKMTVRAIEDLLKIAPVEVVCINGNHDDTTSVFLGLFCQAWFRNDKDVTFKINNNNPRVYSVFGNTLLCFAHDANEKTLPRTIADERRDVWSQVTNTEVFLQHMHTEYESKNDYHMRINRLPAACECSNWATRQGYVARPQCKAFLFDTDGLSEVMYVNL